MNRIRRAAPHGGNRTPASARAEGSVRIIGGRWRGSRLPLVAAPGLRPSSDRGRETLFNWLQPMLPGARVLDLFAGSGALGLEALSRGAAEAVMIEREARQAALLAASIQRLQAPARLVTGDALQWLRKPPAGTFDLAFLDPPFDAGLWELALALLPPWLAPDAWLYLESPAQARIDAGPGWHLHRELATRHAHLALYRRDGT